MPAVGLWGGGVRITGSEVCFWNIPRNAFPGILDVSLGGYDVVEAFEMSFLYIHSLFLGAFSSSLSEDPHESSGGGDTLSISGNTGKGLFLSTVFWDPQQLSIGWEGDPEMESS